MAVEEELLEVLIGRAMAVFRLAQRLMRRHGVTFDQLNTSAMERLSGEPWAQRGGEGFRQGMERQLQELRFNPERNAQQQLQQADPRVRIANLESQLRQLRQSQLEFLRRAEVMRQDILAAQQQRDLGLTERDNQDLRDRLDYDDNGIPDTTDQIHADEARNQSLDDQAAARAEGTEATAESRDDRAAAELREDVAEERADRAEDTAQQAQVEQRREEDIRDNEEAAEARDEVDGATLGAGLTGVEVEEAQRDAQADGEPTRFDIENGTLQPVYEDQQQQAEQAALGQDPAAVDGQGVDGRGVDGQDVDGPGADGQGVDALGADGTGLDGQEPGVEGDRQFELDENGLFTEADGNRSPAAAAEAGDRYSLDENGVLQDGRPDELEGDQPGADQESVPVDIEREPALKTGGDIGYANEVQEAADAEQARQDGPGGQDRVDGQDGQGAQPGQDGAAAQQVGPPAEDIAIADARANGQSPEQNEATKPMSDAEMEQFKKTVGASGPAGGPAANPDRTSEPGPNGARPESVRVAAQPRPGAAVGPRQESDQGRG